MVETTEVRLALLENNLALTQTQIISMGKELEERIRDSETRITRTIENRIQHHTDQLKLISERVEKISQDIVRLNNADIEDKARQQQTIIAVVIIIAIIEAFVKFR